MLFMHLFDMYRFFTVPLAIVGSAYLFHLFGISYVSHRDSTSTNTNVVGTMSMSRNVVKRVLAVEQLEGAGEVIRRSIGSKELRNLSPFLMLDYFVVSKGAGFPDHPHRGQATVTYITQGSSRHEDSAGHKGTIVAGGVQWMCAGRGIVHAEMPVLGPGVPEPRGLQLWVDLPKKYKMVEPSYQELGPEEIPSAFPEGSEGPVQIKVISGKSHGVESPVRPLGGCWYFHVIFKRRSTIFQDIPAGWTSFIYILSGSVIVNPSGSSHHEEVHHTLVLSAAQNETGVAIQATEDETEVILIAGEPLDQPVYQYGPFVMTTREEIQQTLWDYGEERLREGAYLEVRDWKPESEV